MSPSGQLPLALSEHTLQKDTEKLQVKRKVEKNNQKLGTAQGMHRESKCSTWVLCFAQTQAELHISTRHPHRRLGMHQATLPSTSKWT